MAPRKKKYFTVTEISVNFVEMSSKMIHIPIGARDQYYKTSFAIIELLLNYGKILMHCVG